MPHVSLIDSHTEGEPTRVVLEGAPDLGRGSLSERREIFAREGDLFRASVIGEPRGAAHLVGALLCEPCDAACATGVNFFNNAGVLQMCGHGTIGVMATLSHLGRIAPGAHRIETPVGIVQATLQSANRVSVQNVPSYRWKKSVEVAVEGCGVVAGDIAWGGNWFFLVEASQHRQKLEIARWRELTEYARRLKCALVAQNISGREGAEIDHIELSGPPARADADERNFVLCPGDAFDRSPCGTGTSAKMACLHADGHLQAGQIWRRESILGTLFKGQIEVIREEAGAAGETETTWPKVLPTISGSAYITGETRLLFDPRDPLRDGICF